MGRCRTLWRSGTFGYEPVDGAIQDEETRDHEAVEERGLKPVSVLGGPISGGFGGRSLFLIQLFVAPQPCAQPLLLERSAYKKTFSAS